MRQLFLLYCPIIHLSVGLVEPNRQNKIVFVKNMDMTKFVCVMSIILTFLQEVSYCVRVTCIWAVSAGGGDAGGVTAVFVILNLKKRKVVCESVRK